MGLSFKEHSNYFARRKTLLIISFTKTPPTRTLVSKGHLEPIKTSFITGLEKQPQHMGELNSWLQVFIHRYNTWRLHQSLDDKTLEEVVKLYLML